MSGAAMNKNISTALAAILMLAGCSNAPAQPPLADAPLAGATIGGDFTLTDQDGKKRSYSEFGGQYRIVYFGYTNCPDICTPDVQNLMAGLKAFEKSSPELGQKVQPIFITVDPERDTSAVLKQFTAAFHPRLIGLTGTEAEIAETAKKFAVYYAKAEGSAPNAYLMSHSQTPYLMAADGKPLAILPAANEGGPDRVATELAKWVR
jgi:protein SCO1/2